VRGAAEFGTIQVDGNDGNAGLFGKGNGVATASAKGIEDDNIIIGVVVGSSLTCLTSITRASQICQSRRDVVGNLFRRDAIPSFFVELDALIEPRKEAPPLIPVLVQFGIVVRVGDAAVHDLKRRPLFGCCRGVTCRSSSSSSCSSLRLRRHPAHGH
jgi:hypothetical protein